MSMFSSMFSSKFLFSDKARFLIFEIVLWIDEGLKRGLAGTRITNTIHAVDHELGTCCFQLSLTFIVARIRRVLVEIHPHQRPRLHPETRSHSVWIV